MMIKGVSMIISSSQNGEAEVKASTKIHSKSSIRICIKIKAEFIMKLTVQEVEDVEKDKI